MRRARRGAGVVVGALAAGALTVAALRLGWLLQWPRALLAGLLVAAAVAALGLIAIAQDLVGPGRWPDPRRTRAGRRVAPAGAPRGRTAQDGSTRYEGRRQRVDGTDKGGAMSADGATAGTATAGTPAVRPAAVEEVVAAGAAVLEAVGRVVVGQADALRLTLAAVLAGGHVLLEDVPGLGKTLAARSLAAGARPRVPPAAVHARPAAGRHHRVVRLRPAAGDVRRSTRGRCSPVCCSPTRSTGPPRRRSPRCSRRCRRGR